jgi:hypothetical protein
MYIMYNTFYIEWGVHNKLKSASVLVYNNNTCVCVCVYPLTKSEREYGSNSVTYWVYVC